MEIKTKGEILRSYGITPKTNHHNWDYVYKSIRKAMDDYALEVCNPILEKLSNPPNFKEDNETKTT